jgi:hypothetical protein
MTPPIVEHVKAALPKLQNAEHFDVCKTDFIEPLTALIQAVPALAPIFQAMLAVFLRIDELFKNSLSASQTKQITELHIYRRSLFILFKHVVVTASNSIDFQDKAAAAALRPLLQTYKKIPTATYVQSSGLVDNFVNDCGKSPFLAAITALGMGVLVTKMGSVNGQFRHLAQERDIDHELIVNSGKLSEARAEMDATIDMLITTTNSTYILNEMGAKDAALRGNLNLIVNVINAAIHRVKVILGDRRHRRPGKTDNATQTPDTSNPPAPDTPPQNPGNITPPTIDPDELNPPAVGER